MKKHPCTSTVCDSETIPVWGTLCWSLLEENSHLLKDTLRLWAAMVSRKALLYMTENQFHQQLPSWTLGVQRQWDLDDSSVARHPESGRYNIDTNKGKFYFASQRATRSQKLVLVSSWLGYPQHRVLDIVEEGSPFAYELARWENLELN